MNTKINETPGKKFFDRGNQLQLEGKEDAAIVAYRYAIQVEPNFYRTYNSLAGILREKGELEEAIKLYRRCLQLNPNSFWSYHGLSAIFLKQDLIDKAIEAAIKSLEKIEQFAGFDRASKGKLYFQLAKALHKKGTINKAKENYQKAIDYNPELGFAYQALGEILSLEEKWQAGLDAYQKALELIPKSAAVYCNIGEIWQKLGNLKEAIRAYRQSLEINPNRAQTHHELGYSLEKEGKYDEAIICYLKALEINPNLTHSYHNILAISNNKNLPPSFIDPIIESCKKRITSNPTDITSHIRLGDMLAKRGKKVEALNAYKEVTLLVNSQRKPNYVKKYWDLGTYKGADFAIVGTMKGGTSSLYEYLIQHPQVLPSSQKELHFFTLNWSKGKDWYLAQFPPIPEGENFITGEASPSYLDWIGELKQRPAEVKQLFPNIKLIALLRNPIDRALSSHSHLTRIGSAHRPFEEAVKIELEQMKQITEEQKASRRGLLTAGLYVYKLKEWMSVFPQEQFLVLKSEDLYQDTANTVNKVFNFLNLPPFQLEQYQQHNSGSYNPIKEELRTELTEFFAPYNQQLEEYLGQKFNWY